MSDAVWKGRTALVTGASRGIGAAVARGVAAEGGHVALLARDTDALTAVADTCRAVAPPRTPPPAVAVADVTDPGQLEAASRSLLDDLGGRLDLLANVAGSSLRHARVEEMTDDDWQGALDLNLLAPVRLQRHCFAALREAGGTVVNIGSVVADRAAVLGSTYAAAKAALQSLTRSSALEWARYGIRSVCVEPGYVDTAFNARLKAAGLEERLLERVPTRRPLEPEDVARVVLFAGAPTTLHLTGETIRIDGGYAARL